MLYNRPSIILKNSTYIIIIITPKYFLPMISLPKNSTISINAITISCKGEVFPISTPKEISTVAAAKSAPNMLRNLKNRNKISYYRISSHHMLCNIISKQIFENYFSIINLGKRLPVPCAGHGPTQSQTGC